MRWIELRIHVLKEPATRGHALRVAAMLTDEILFFSNKLVKAIVGIVGHSSDSLSSLASSLRS